MSSILICKGCEDILEISGGPVTNQISNQVIGKELVAAPMEEYSILRGL